MTINGDLSKPVVVDTQAMAWTASPSQTVYRKRVHLVGDVESGQVTSVVRFEPGASFAAHDHPEGEEILVLAGIFSDEQGDWPAGTFLLNPEGFRHAPSSAPGCTLFVKLRQYPGRSRRHVALDTTQQVWVETAQAGLRVKTLYAQDGYADAMRLERWDENLSLAARTFANGAELFVVRGEFEDEVGRHGPGSWLRFPPGHAHRPTCGKSGCELYVKEGGFAYLRQGSS